MTTNPAPWTQEKEGLLWVVRDGDGGIVADVRFPSSARIVSAAPELLDALEEGMSAMCDKCEAIHCSATVNPCGSPCAEWAKMDAVSKKARGE